MAKSIFQKKKTEKHKKKKQVTVLVSQKKKKYNLSLQLPSCLCTSLNILERIYYKKYRINTKIWYVAIKVITTCKHCCCGHASKSNC